MVLKNCLKISHRGLTKNIVCDSNLRYEDIVSKIIATFELTDIHRSAIQIYDEHGSKFDKDIFEYFILLFPNPHKLFFIRLDTSKLTINMPPTNGYNNANDPMTTRNAFTVSKSMNQIKKTNDIPNNMNSSEAVPVRRQNCFLGQLPNDDAPEQPINNEDNNNDLWRRHHYQQNIVRGMVKKIKKFQETQLKRKHLTTPTIVKRSMRL